MENPEENKNIKDSTPQLETNWKGVGTTVFIVLCLFGFGILAFQPWIVGAIIGIIISCNTKKKAPPTIVEINGQKVEVTDENRSAIRKERQKAIQKEQHEHNLWIYEMVKNRYQGAAYRGDYDFKTYYEYIPATYPSLVKYLTPELKQLHGITDEWLKEREKDFYDTIKAAGYERQYEQHKKDNINKERWWDITEPLITEEEFKKRQQEWRKMMKLEV